MNILDMDLTPEDKEAVANLFEEWRKEELDKMSVALNESKEEEIKKIEEGLISYKEAIEEEYVDKVNVIVESLKPQLKKQILVEMNETNPDLLVMEKIKEIMFPLVNEESGKTYVNEISLLKKENEELKRQNELDEGEKKKGKLLEGYSAKTSKILDKMIGEGSATEITEKFYEVLESFDGFKEETDVEAETNLDAETQVAEGAGETITTETPAEGEVEIIDEDFQPTVETDTIEELEDSKKEDSNINSFKKHVLSRVTG